MIVVVCLNPALDITHEVAEVDWAGVNRPAVVLDRPGGKGTNGGRILHSFGVELVLLGFAGGATGSAVRAGLRRLAVPARLTSIAGETRRLPDNTTAWALPAGLPDSSYATLIRLAADEGVPAVLDTSGAALRRGVAAGPAIVKPNLSELQDLAAEPLSSAGGPDLPGVAAAATRLRAAGAAPAAGEFSDSEYHAELADVKVQPEDCAGRPR